MAAFFRGAIGALVEGVKEKTAIEQERKAYQEEALYFKKGEELKDEGPGNKINRSHVDAIIAAANMGVTTGLISKSSADRFVATQYQELRNDFAVNAIDKKGKLTTFPITPGRSYKAADSLYGMQSSKDITFIEPNQAIDRGREFHPNSIRYATSDVNSPYTEKASPDQLYSNSKLALLTWITKKGKTDDETTVNWNGEGKDAKEHLANVKQRELDLTQDYNKDLRSYMSERLNYESKYKLKPEVSKEEKDFQEGIRKTEWFKEFKQQYGEEPNLDDKSYDYRSAWKAGIRPERYAPDKNRYHWPSSLPNGKMLKSENHPTAWKEYYMRETGKNPDEVGATKADYEKLKLKSKK